MLAAIRSATLFGLDGQVVTVEVHVSSGLPAFTVVGLPDTAVRESRERARAAMLSSGLDWPMRRITVNLAPATVRKSGSCLELAVALGVIVAGGDLHEAALDQVGVIGELGLDGSIRAVAGVLVLVDAMQRAGCEYVVVPQANAAEAALVPGVTVRPARRLDELRACLKDEEPWPEIPESAPVAAAFSDEPLDLADVHGLPIARRALTAAAAGGHHLLLVGPPGVGKTMLARRLPSIMPPLGPEEAIEVTRIHSVAGLAADGRLIGARPFRSPHHTATTAALVGGGSARIRPGEITLAHRGALFLDELGEFAPTALDALRQPLEEKSVRISRMATSLAFPADFTLIACCNPCPCGLSDTACRCSDAMRARYRRRLSAPLLDRFDLRLAVRPPDPDAAAGASSEEVRAQVDAAVARQGVRLADWPWRRNGEIPGGALERLVPLGSDAARLWSVLRRERSWSARGAARVRRVARTLADLDDRSEVTCADIGMAADLREEIV
ncbi:MAG: YifB family Mg chelatase-like AAA ATPase [Acidimicrobiia bacterium]|nr:YifB family Mg chelatase-like AAA ATPase [Acidimicrobiia bacterium]